MYMDTLFSRMQGVFDGLVGICNLYGKYVYIHKIIYIVSYTNIKDIYYIGGFGKATKISVNKYLENYEP